MSDLDFKCPVCGNVVIDEQGTYKCSHLAFLYVSEGGFEYKTHQIDELLEDLDIDEDGIEKLEQKLPDDITVHKLEDDFPLSSITVSIGINQNKEIK